MKSSLQHVFSLSLITSWLASSVGASGLRSSAFVQPSLHNRARLFLDVSRRQPWVRTSLYMGKGDGKNKNKKKKKKKGGTSSDIIPNSGSVAPEPRRVTSQSIAVAGMSVKMQIRLVKEAKRVQTQHNCGYIKPKVKTKYRKVSVDDDDEDARTERRRVATDKWSAAFDTNSTSSPLVMVDGYNVIGKWPRLQKRMRMGRPHEARRMLLDLLGEVAAMKGWNIECVFDGAGRVTSSPLSDKISDSGESKGMDGGVSVVFSAVGESADIYIQRYSLKYQQENGGKITGSLVVVTDDNIIRNAAVGAGAVLMSSKRMVDELRNVRKSTMAVVEHISSTGSRGSATRGFFQYQSGHFLPDREMFDRLEREIEEKRAKKRQEEEEKEGGNGVDV